MPTARNKLYLVLFGLLGLALLVLFVARSPEKRARPAQASDWTPEETVEAFIEAQERGDAAAAGAMITIEARSEFEETTRSMEHDDIVAAGLQFRQEKYRLEESAATSAIFYSTGSALYLAMTREENRWRVDPLRTDQLNREKAR
jgi:hypothetical protein